MAVFKCKMCGGALELSGNETVVTCDYCDSVQTVSKKNDDVIANLFNRANNLRIKGEFDKAAEVYERIINEDNTDAEAYWGLVLCKYGIEYVEDPKTFKRIPTCHRTQYESILTDVDYKAAISNADSVSQGVYKTQAEEIANLQKDILAIVKNEKPFDVFICYKETDENGKRTVDSALANDIYYQLTQEGLKVFYAAITLEDKLGVEYEPYIFAALNSAKVMLVVGTKPKYFEAVWVKNEWSRYLKIMKTDRSKILIPCYRDMDAYDLPDEFSHLQAQDMSKIGFVNDVVRGIRKIITPDVPKAEKETVIVNQSTTGNAGALIKRAFMALEDGDFVRADDFCEQVLNIDAENAEAYLGKLMAELKVKTRGNLANCALPFNGSNNYKKAVRFGNEALVSELEGYINHINERNELNRLEGIYNQAFSAMSSATTEAMFKQAAGIFRSISGYKDSDKLAADCLAKAEEKRIEAEHNRLEGIYNQAFSAMSSATTEAKFKQAAGIFRSISGYKDSDKLAADCLAKAEENRLEGIYNQAFSAMSSATTEAMFKEASGIFRSISGYKDSAKLAEDCLAKAEENRLEGIYNQALFAMASATTEAMFKQAADKFRSISEYKNSDKLAADCLSKAEERRIEAKRNREIEKKIITITLAAAATLICVGILVFNIIIPASQYNKALKLVEEGNYDQAIAILAELGNFKDAEDKIKDAKDKILETHYLKAVEFARKSDFVNAAIAYGKACNYKDAKEKSFELWDKIAVRDTVAAGWSHTVALKSDGTVIAVGDNDYGRCDVSGWTDIVAVSADNSHTVGLQSDGTVVAVGDNGYGQCDVDGWKDIVAVSANFSGTVGLKSDGTVVTTETYDDVSSWTDIVAIASGNVHTVGLKSDGTVVAVGNNDDCQCDVSGWTDIVAVSAGDSHTVGLKSDGTVVAVGDNDDGQCNVADWTDIVAISAGYSHTVGLKSDGTVVAVGDNYYGQCDVSDWTDIVEVSAGLDHTVGLKSDGTVVAVGANSVGRCDVDGWKDIKQPKK